MNGLITLGNIYDYIRPVIDICLLTFILYKSYEVLVKTNGLQLLKVIIIFAVAYVLATFLQLSLILWIFTLFLGH